MLVDAKLSIEVPRRSAPKSHKEILLSSFFQGIYFLSSIADVIINTSQLQPQPHILA